MTTESNAVYSADRPHRTKTFKYNKNREHTKYTENLFNFNSNKVYD